MKNNFSKIFRKNAKKGLTKAFESAIISKSTQDAGMAQSVEHVIGNDEVISSILITSSKKHVAIAACFFTLCIFWATEQGIFSLHLDKRGDFWYHYFSIVSLGGTQ